MLNWPLVILYGALCAGAIVSACFYEDGRRPSAIAGAAMLTVNWLQFVLSYTPYTPWQDFAPQDGWAMIDALCGVLILAIAFDRIWGWALWLCALIQIMVHGGYKIGLYDDVFYTDRLDNMLLVQLAIFYFIGGRGVTNRMHRCIDRLGLSRRAGASALSRRE